MLKPRYILIIIIMFFIGVTIAGFCFEQVFIERAARTAYIYTTTAAECALKNATMSDEFFTSGVTRDGAAAKAASINGRNVNTSTALEGLLVDDGTNSFKRQNVFLWTYGISGGNVVDNAISAYEAMFTADEFENWATTILDLTTKTNKENASRQVYWVDELFYLAPGDEAPSLHWASGTTRIPKILTMGTDLFITKMGYSENLIYDAMSDVAEAKPDSAESFFGKSYYSVYADLDNVQKVAHILGAADYWDYVRTSSITVGSDNWWKGEEDVTFFYTPTSLGLTYLDPNVLDVFFRSNLDLLMRAQYIEGSYVGSTASVKPDYLAWFGNEDGVNYQSTVNGAWGEYAVNNGVFYYLRGKPTRDGQGIMAYANPVGGYYQKPEIEYMYVTMSAEDIGKMSSAERNAWNQVLQRAISPVTTLESLVTEHTANMKERYELCVAKVTFYADFFVPYTSAPMRGMAKNFGTNTGDYNESDMRGLEVSEDLLDTAVGLLLNGKPVSSFKTADSAVTGSQQLVYTTYYAIVN